MEHSWILILAMIGHVLCVYHFKGFLIGCIYTTLTALIFARIDYAILYFRMWK